MVSAENPIPPADPVALYLAQLELALQGRNPVLIHDALVDAESHLRAAVAAGAAPQQAVEDFGTPEDIAKAYVDADRGNGGAAVAGSAAALPLSSSAMLSGSGPGPASPPPESFLRRARRFPILGIWFNPYAWGSLIFFTTIGFAFATAVFSWVVTMGSLSIATLPILIGLIFLLLLLGSVRGLCLLDGILCQFFLGVRMPRRTQPVYTTSGISLWQRLGCWLRDVRSWLSLGYLLGNFPVAIALFTVFVSLVSVSAFLVGLPIATLFGGGGIYSDESFNLIGTDYVPDEHGFVEIPFGTLFVMFIGGWVLATGTLWLARGIGWVYGHVVQAIQVARPRAVLVRPVETVEVHS